MEPGAARLCFEVGEAEAGQRLDVTLSGLARVSRAQVQRWIAAGRVSLNAEACRASQRLGIGDEILACPPEPVAAVARPEPIPLAVVYEDADLIVVDKPPDMVVHPAPGHARGTLVNALLHHCEGLAGVGGVLRPGIVHRLDRGTSGLIVAAKDDETHRALARQFHDHTIERLYRAVVRGVPGPDEGMDERPVGRHPRDRKRMSVQSGSGRRARTRWRVERRFPASDASALSVRPETGRTHQIRVHLSSSGLPILGDPVYGRARPPGGVVLDRPALHAARLGFDHPRRGERLRFEAPLPADLARMLEVLAAREPSQ